jgi:hypothetical protein
MSSLGRYCLHVRHIVIILSFQKENVLIVVTYFSNFVTVQQWICHDPKFEITFGLQPKWCRYLPSSTANRRRLFHKIKYIHIGIVYIFDSHTFNDFSHYVPLIILRVRDPGVGSPWHTRNPGFEGAVIFLQTASCCQNVFKKEDLQWHSSRIEINENRGISVQYLCICFN